MCGALGHGLLDLYLNQPPPAIVLKPDLLTMSCLWINLPVERKKVDGGKSLSSYPCPLPRFSSSIHIYNFAA